MAAKKNPLEGLSELRTEYRVDDRVQGRIEVAEPQEEREERVANLALFAQRHEQCCDEERQPADNKSARDDGQCLGSLSFPFRLQCLLALCHLRLRIVGRLRAGRDDCAVLHGCRHLTGTRRQLLLMMMEKVLLRLVDQLDQVLRMLRGFCWCRGTCWWIVADGNWSQICLVRWGSATVDVTSTTGIIVIISVVAIYRSYRIAILVILYRLIADYKMGHRGDLMCCWCGWLLSNL